MPLSTANLAFQQPRPLTSLFSANPRDGGIRYNPKKTPETPSRRIGHCTQMWCKCLTAPSQRYMERTLPECGVPFLSSCLAHAKACGKAGDGIIPALRPGTSMALCVMPISVLLHPRAPNGPLLLELSQGKSPLCQVWPGWMQRLSLPSLFPHTSSPGSPRPSSWQEMHCGLRLH